MRYCRRGRRGHDECNDDRQTPQDEYQSVKERSYVSLVWAELVGPNHDRDRSDDCGDPGHHGPNHRTSNLMPLSRSQQLEESRQRDGRGNQDHEATESTGDLHHSECDTGKRSMCRRYGGLPVFAEFCDHRPRHHEERPPPKNQQRSGAGQVRALQGVPEETRCSSSFDRAASRQRESNTEGNLRRAVRVVEEGRQFFRVSSSPRSGVPADHVLEAVPFAHGNDPMTRDPQPTDRASVRSPSLRSPVSTNVRISRIASVSAARPLAEIRYGRRRSSTGNGSINPRSSRRVIAPYKVPGPRAIPEKSSMSFVRAHPCLEPETRLVRMSTVGSLDRAERCFGDAVRRAMF